MNNPIKRAVTVLLFSFALMVLVLVLGFMMQILIPITIVLGIGALIYVHTKKSELDANSYENGSK